MLYKGRVHPAAGQDQLNKTGQDSFEIWVKAKPIQGQANQAVRQLLAEYFHKQLADIRLIKGFRQRQKIIEVK